MDLITGRMWIPHPSSRIFWDKESVRHMIEIVRATLYARWGRCLAYSMIIVTDAVITRPCFACPFVPMSGGMMRGKE